MGCKEREGRENGSGKVVKENGFKKFLTKMT